MKYDKKKNYRIIYLSYFIPYYGIRRLYDNQNSRKSEYEDFTTEQIPRKSEYEDFTTKQIPRKTEYEDFTTKQFLSDTILEENPTGDISNRPPPYVNQSFGCFSALQINEKKSEK